MWKLWSIVVILSLGIGGCPSNERMPVKRHDNETLKINDTHRISDPANPATAAPLARPETSKSAETAQKTAISPRVVTKIIDPGNGPGTDYTSLKEFARREKRDLVAANEIAVALCRSTDGSPDGPAQFSDWITDSLHYVKVLAAPGHRATAQWDDRKYRIIEHTTINSECVDVEIGHFIIDGIQMKLTGRGKNNDVIDPGKEMQKLVVQNCFLWLDVDTVSGSGLDPGCDADIMNNVFLSTGGGQAAVLQKVKKRDKLPVINLYNNTFVGWQRVVKTEGICRVVNNLVVNSRSPHLFVVDEGSAGQFTADSDYNSADIAGAALVRPPRNPHQAPWFNGDFPPSQLFINPAGNDFRLKAETVLRGIAIGPAADPRVPPTDISGNSRHGKRTDPGAVLSAGSGSHGE